MYIMIPTQMSHVRIICCWYS